MLMDRQYKMDVERLSNEILTKEFQLKGICSEKAYLETDLAFKQKQIDLLQKELQESNLQVQKLQKVND